MRTIFKKAFKLNEEIQFTVEVIKVNEHKDDAALYFKSSLPKEVLRHHSIQDYFNRKRFLTMKVSELKEHLNKKFESILNDEIVKMYSLSEWPELIELNIKIRDGLFCSWDKDRIIRYDNWKYFTLDKSPMILYILNRHLLNGLNFKDSNVDVKRVYRKTIEGYISSFSLAENYIEYYHNFSGMYRVIIKGEKIDFLALLVNGRITIAINLSPPKYGLFDKK